MLFVELRVEMVGSMEDPWLLNMKGKKHEDVKTQ